METLTPYEQLLMDQLKAHRAALDESYRMKNAAVNAISELKSKCPHRITSERTFSHDSLWLCCDVCGDQLRFLR